MNNVKLLIIGLLAFFAGGIAVYMMMPSITQGAAQEKATAKAAKPLYWVAPMDPNYKRDQPGKSPMGMDLIPAYEEANSKDDVGVVRISPVVENNLGVKLAKVIQEDLSLQIRTVGFIGFNEDSVTHFHSRVDGWIEKLSVTAVGDPVEKGQKLFELYSPELVNAQEEYLIAYRGRNSQLFSAAKRKLESLGVDEKQITVLRKEGKVNQRLAFYAQNNGYVANLNVREGSFLKPDKNVMSVGSLDGVWVIAEIFERQAGWVKPGQTVEMTTDSYPGKTWRGVVSYLYPVLNSQTRTLKARIVFENPNEFLKPNMFTELLIEAGLQHQAFSVPRDAVIRSGSMSRVVKAMGSGRFKSVLVKTGVESGQRIEILKGLQVGDNVVVSAQFLIDSESSLSGELSRMEEPVKNEQSDYLPISVRASDDASASSSKQHDLSHQKQTRTRGVIKQVMSDMHMLNVTHEPIPEWKWPTMTMMFEVSEKIDLQTLKAGQQINFQLLETVDGDYIVTKLYESEGHSQAN